MSWHYQVRKTSDSDDVTWYDIVEVYQSEPLRWTERGMAPGGETQEELIHDLEMMLADAKKYPVFEEPKDE